MTGNQLQGLELSLKHRISVRWQCVEQPHSCTISALIIKEMVDRGMRHLLYQHTSHSLKELSDDEARKQGINPRHLLQMP